MPRTSTVPLVPAGSAAGAPPVPPARLEAGTPAFRRANLALFVGGFATFAMLYATQPILPLLAGEFAVSPARASLSVSAGTGALALALIPASILSDRYGRSRVMNIALALAAVLALAAAFVTDFDQLLVLRALLGLALAGLPAAAMAWLGEEIAPNAQGRAMGLYIAGNALGGMSGRFLAALLTDFASWRIALGVLGVLGVAAALAFWRCLPASRHFSARPATPRRILRDVVTIYCDAGLPWLFTTAFLIMGAFVGLYNYLGFRLQAAPFGLGQTAVGAIFLLYLLGTFASAWAGQLADRIGRRNVLWIMTVVMAAGLLLTVSEHLAVVIAGVGVFTFGYFATHTAASSWVGKRAQERRALAAALYLCSYYFGSSVLGTVGGFAWSAGQWPGTVAMLLGCTLLALAVALWLRRLPPAKG
ncbi:MFS transporter [Pseudothauera rhizosphaerae]|uniref:MFS transporter n=1 Tax=Pseudothauera rhizosphaerae TaxID=2565932 RepID=A0A4S4A832_9RHOO|nr:MFS transporter [Pseudothauera rhizosphaerae]THF54884.1 MFS transporter [Pseudothauera rhizosphaerae]